MSQQSEGGCFGKANVTRYGFCNEEEKKRKKLIKNFLTLITLITNIFIISGVTRHWYSSNDNNGKFYIEDRQALQMIYVIYA